ncbi:MAG: transketolase [Acidimicrobiales bacterium]
MTDPSTATPRASEAFDKRAIEVIRGLAMDAPHAARSGHQGTAMALAPLAHVLFSRIMTYDAAAPDWPDRDRFVLSAGHASILQYSMLYLAGFGVELDDLRDFRQWDSITPGHPEVHVTPGVEVTTGPLGQGFANAVGMAIAERWLRARFGSDVSDHHTFVICGDGDLSEGVSHEAASLAGHQRLGRLIAVYDDNRITIDGSTELALSDDAPKRFAAYGWNVIELGEQAEDLDAIEVALRTAMDTADAPSLVVLRSHIATPSPTRTGDPAAHGYALVDDDIAATKEVLGLPVDEAFHVPDEVVDTYREIGARGRDARLAWEARMADRTEDRTVIDACLAGRGLPGWETRLPHGTVGEQVATRKASGSCLVAAAAEVPGLVAGSADLTANTGTELSDAALISAEEPGGRQLHYGVREHAMGSIMTGMALHGGILPVGGTFLVFSDYMRPAIRLAALSEAKVIYSFTHDSVGVGEDGPTHQPVEQLMSLRTIPGLRVIRPADANETAAAWRIAVDGDGPTALILTRQNVPVLDGTDAEATDRGAYVLRDVEDPEVVLIGTGSEVSVCIDAAEALGREGIAARVVSMPSWDLFGAQEPDYVDSVLPPEVPTVSIEAGVTLGWERWADITIGIDRFGASAPGSTVMEKLGITAGAVIEAAKAAIETV